MNAWLSHRFGEFSLYNIGDEAPDDYLDEKILVVKGNPNDLKAECWVIWSHEYDKTTRIENLLTKSYEAERLNYTLRKAKS